jgi:hypothetical protein
MGGELNFDNGEAVPKAVVNRAEMELYAENMATKSVMESCC